jgi:phage portal protein BeeE
MAASRQSGNIFGGGSGARDAQSYSFFRQWVYTSVNFIAKRLAGQPWSAGELTNAERDDKKPPKKACELSLRQPWMKHTVAKSILRRNAPNQDLDVFQSHAILDTIDRPNPLQRRSEFMYMSVASLLLTGVCYWVGGKVKGKKSPNDKQADGDKIELWAIPSHLVEPLHKDGLFSHYKIKMSAQDMSGQEIPAANVARTYIPDPSDIMGVFSPLNACIRAIRTDDHVQGSQEGLFARGLMPHVGVVIGEAATQQFAPILTGPQRHQIERMIVELYNRTTNDGMPAIFDGMIKDIRRLDPMPREMDWKVSGEIVRDRILRAYGISLLLLGDTQGGNRAQAVMAEENAAANVFNPLADTFTETACEWLAPMFEAEQTTSRIWVWVNPFVAHDEEMTSRQWDAARKNGDVDRNEYRAERLGLPPREDEIQKSALVETVGGVTGAIAVATAVGQGVLEPEQAQTIFQQFFGLDGKVAKQLAGEKKPQPAAPGPGQGAPGFPAATAAPAEKPAATEGQPAVEEPAEPGPGKSVKYSDDQPRADDGKFGTGSGSGTAESSSGKDSSVKQETETPKTKSEIAKSSAVYVGKEIQRYSEEHNEPILAKGVSGKSLKDNEPVDVVTEIDGKTHGIELKTVVVGKNDKLTMKREAQEKKAKWERKEPGRCHTVVFDDRNVKDAKGPGKHDESQRVIYYRRGFGSMRLGAMHKVTGGMKELKDLLSMDKRKLPKGAKQFEEGGAE